MVPDAQLLQRYVAQRDETAFSELVQRHLGLVYASALRRTSGRAHLAHEIAQSVFTDLARKAATLQHHPVLLAWLYRSTRYAAIAAIREEARRQKLAHDVASMTAPFSNDEPAAAWEQLRPLIDDSIDQLKERDRTVLLLRYFDGLTFAAIGARLNLSENTARMRVDRALEKLRGHLQSRGLASTGAALALTLSHSAVAGAPSGLAATVASTALATVPAGAGSGLAAILLMSKITAPAVSAIVASASALLLWTSFAPQTDAKELAALREENTRLANALAPGAAPEAIAAVAATVDSKILETARVVEQRSARVVSAPHSAPPTAASSPHAPRTSGATDSDPTQHRNRGQATPHDAFMSFAWAGDSGEVDALAQLLWFDPDVRPKAEAVLASMPASLRANYDTPEKLFALIYAAEAIIAPPPAPDLIEHWAVAELAAGRVALRRPGSKPGIDYHQYQQTGDGWKYVVPEVAVQNMPAVLTNETLAKTARP